MKNKNKMDLALINSDLCSCLTC